MTPGQFILILFQIWMFSIFLRGFWHHALECWKDPDRNTWNFLFAVFFLLVTIALGLDLFVW